MAAILDFLPITLNFASQSLLSRITVQSALTVFLFLTLSILIFTLYSVLKNGARREEEKSLEIQSFPEIDGEQSEPENGAGPDRENLAGSLLLKVLPADSAKWDALYEDDPGEKKRKKKRARRKRPGPREELLCLYPFTRSSSATQRKIKQQYDQLVRSHGSKGLTLAQVGQFVNCLVEARNELQKKSEVIKRRFTITKALLYKADRSSFDRLRQQIYKLELEQKRLEEDTFVYNWLQEQLKLSPAYKKMLEFGARMEMEAESSNLVDSAEADFSDISFEELLAQEKKDSFWQRNGKLKSSSSWEA